MSTAAGNERKTTGSYYTPDSLVQCLLDSALDPVVVTRLKESKKVARQLNGKANSDWTLDDIKNPPHWLKSFPKSKPANTNSLAEHALLTLKVVDPACGSGHFLIAAAHRIARRLSSVRTGESEPSPEDYQCALRDVVRSCIYGVDMNPMAVELCKVSMWMEAIEPGKPLSFLDNHIQCGNSLLGTTPALLAKGIPDSAFKPIEGDVKAICSDLKKDNKKERLEHQSGQGLLFDPPIKLGNLPATFAAIATGSADSVEEVADTERRYHELVGKTNYINARLLADTWCSVFVWNKDESDLGRLCPTEKKFREIESNPHSILPHVRLEVEKLAKRYRFLSLIHI